ncbi:hypothetical protein TNCT_239361 [Trichonephila clavata]|uniref:Uncharacterized protein n=1 Tax=Trichonephila clavata TaxID=2740835 RepID=A0A8X6KKU2_TRICU|nr:hypothetical protein TNCT_239361 [Trichonephila clavata]
MPVLQEEQGKCFKSQLLSEIIVRMNDSSIASLQLRWKFETRDGNSTIILNLFWRLECCNTLSVYPTVKETTPQIVKSTHGSMLEIRDILNSGG